MWTVRELFLGYPLPVCSGPRPPGSPPVHPTSAVGRGLPRPPGWGWEVCHVSHERGELTPQSAPGSHTCGPSERQVQR